LTDTPQLLLSHHLKALKLPTFLREYEKLARQCAAEGLDHVRFLLRLVELELIDRERRMWSVGSRKRGSRRSKASTASTSRRFLRSTRPSSWNSPVPSSDPSRNVIAVGNSGPGKTHIALGIGLAACQKGLSVGFYVAAALVHELLEARISSAAARPWAAARA